MRGRSKQLPPDSSDDMPVMDTYARHMPDFWPNNHAQMMGGLHQQPQLSYEGKVYRNARPLSIFHCTNQLAKEEPNCRGYLFFINGVTSPPMNWPSCNFVEFGLPYYLGFDYEYNPWEEAGQMHTTMAPFPSNPHMLPTNAYGLPHPSFVGNNNNNNKFYTNDASDMGMSGGPPSMMKTNSWGRGANNSVGNNTQFLQHDPWSPLPPQVSVCYIVWDTV